MRRPRDFDLEMKALGERAKALQDRKVHHLGELVVATGADVVAIDVLAGALLSVAAMTDAATKEEWRRRGAAFFQPTARRSAGRADRDPGGEPKSGGDAKPAAGAAGA